MLPDPIKIMGFMSPGVSREGRGGWMVDGGTEKISAADFFCFLSHLCRHVDPVSLQHMLPRREKLQLGLMQNEIAQELRMRPQVGGGEEGRFLGSQPARTKERHFVHSRRAVVSL